MNDDLFQQLAARLKGKSPKIDPLSMAARSARLGPVSGVGMTRIALWMLEEARRSGVGAGVHGSSAMAEAYAMNPQRLS